MSLEQFIGFDQGEGMSEAALEALKEKMAAAAAQIAAIKKEEGKQKKKEEELLKFLLKFVKTSDKKELVLLISRVLEQNIPANFILAVIVLSNAEIIQEIGHFNLLRSGMNEQSSSRTLIFFNEKDDTLPLKIKIELDTWIKNLLFQAEEAPQKLLKNSYDIEMHELPKEWDFEETQYEKIETIKPVIIQLLTFVMREFLEQHQLSEPYEKLYDFAKFIVTGILNKTKESLEGRKLLN
ncbi:hypothetical protein HZA40_01220 [Candidatus Peregrinibacteria bacterium]|nr:hypothetical protein [Candidatus Peregrinibacteria bacterium]